MVCFHHVQKDTKNFKKQMTHWEVWYSGLGWFTRCAKCEVQGSSLNMGLTWVTFLSSLRFTSIHCGRGARKLWFTIVSLHPSRAPNPVGKVLLWSHLGRIATLVTPLPISTQSKKKVFYNTICIYQKEYPSKFMNMCQV